ncbi:MAG: hypothetical protein Q7R51_00195 [bacterium]|nr:hypothetical protein [bacterium]
MKIIEAPKASQEEPRWTIREGLAKLASLQDQTFSHSRVLRNNKPLHAHYLPYLPDQQPEPEALRSTVLTHQSYPVKQTEQIYQKYFEKQGIIENVSQLMHEDHREIEMLVKPQGLVDGTNIWPIDTTTALFPWVDYSLYLTTPEALARETRNPRDPRGFDISIILNTTRVKGDSYRIDIPNYRELRDLDQWHQSLQSSLEWQAKRYGHKEKDADTLVFRKESQKLVADLLAARE